MGLFGRRKPLHEQLAKALAGVDVPERIRPSWDQVGIHGVSRPRRWDAVASVEAPQLRGDEVHFAALTDGTLVVDEEVAEDALAPLADAVEERLAPPYRAEAVRRGEELWAVAAVRIEVVEVSEEVGGDEIELAEQNGERTLLVDGERAFGSVPTLERLARERYDAYVLRAERLDGSLWQVTVAAL